MHIVKAKIKRAFVCVSIDIYMHKHTHSLTPAWVSHFLFEILALKSGGVERDPSTQVSIVLPAYFKMLSIN